jgi:hypothetical protein
MALTVLLLAVGSALVFWGCSKKSPTGSNTSGGKLYIASYPDSATVTLDGATQSGRTPLTLQNVSAAQHVVKCTKGNFSAVDTVVVHTGRTTPDTAFCWIPGYIYVTSAPSPADILFLGYNGMTASGTTPALWYPAPSDTYVVRCSLSTAGYFKAVDTFRIWADSTAKNYILPPRADSFFVRVHTTSGWQRGTSFQNMDTFEVWTYFSQTIPVDSINLSFQLVLNGNPVGSGNFWILNTYPGVIISWNNGGNRFPLGNYSHPENWQVTPHSFLLANPAWYVANGFLGSPAERGSFRVTLSPTPGWHR